MVFENVYEMITPPSVIKKSWFVEWFYGAALKSYWDQNNIQGVNTFAMVDDIDGGFSIATTANDNDAGSIVAANAERHFSPVGCVQIAVVRRVLANGNYRVGLGNRTDGNFANNPDESIRLVDMSTLTFLRVQTRNGGSATNIDTSIAVNTNFHRIQQELTSTTAQVMIDGILEVTSTTNLPLASSKLYVAFRAASLGANLGESRISYMEAFNT